MKTLVKTLDVVVDNDSIIGINELRVYVPETLPITNTGFKITMTSVQTFRVIGGYFTNSDSENLGTTKEVSANTDTQVILKATSEDCYLIIPNRFKIHNLNLQGRILNSTCLLKFFDDELDFIGIYFRILNVIDKLNGQLQTKNLYANSESILFNSRTAPNFLLGDIADINGNVSQLSVSGDGIYGDFTSLKIIPNLSLINIASAPNIHGTVESISDKMILSTVTYQRTCDITSNGSITYNGKTVPYNKTARITIPANSNTYTVTIS